MRLRGLGHLPRVRGREEAFPPSEAAVASESGRQTHNHPRGCGRPYRPAMLTQSRPFLAVGCGGPLALAGAKGADFFGANPRRNRSGIGLPAPSGGAMRMEGVGSAIGGPSGR